MAAHTPLEFALLYAGREGLAVFPCAPRSKVPLTQHGHLDATTDPTKIECLWAERPDANIGINCKKSGLAVVDVDQHPHGPDGYESLATLEHEHGPLPATWRNLTGGGGLQLIFAAPPDSSLRDGPIAPGIDLKVNGYVCVPPSLHPSGRRYAWEIGHEPWSLPLAPFPDWLGALAQKRPSPRRATVTTPDGTPWRLGEGERNTGLFRLAYAWRRSGVGPDALDVALAAVNREHCQPPLDEGEVAKIVASAARYEPTPDADSSVEWKDVRPWPALDPAALYGLAGEVIRTIAPHTEADPAPMLLTFLPLFGNAVGDGPHVRVGAIRHPARLFSCVVGATARSRKGQGFGEVRSILEMADPVWWEAALAGGLTSGEGIIARVRHDSEHTVEKRAIFYEPEFARTLAAAGRDGSTLSAVLRDAWDSGRLAVTTRKDPLQANGAHIAVIAHVTLEELRVRLSTLDIANGFANRLLFCCSRRSKKLPSGGNLGEAHRRCLADRVREALKIARSRTVITRTALADVRWGEVYQQLPEPLGLFGAVTARADAQLLRLSLVFALLDHAEQIDVAHIDAGVAVWRYAEASAAHVFGGTLGHDHADRLLEELRAVYPVGLTREEQHALFGRHVTAAALGTTRDLLVGRDLAVERVEPTPGRHPQVLYAVPKHAKEAKEGSPGGLPSHLSHSPDSDLCPANGAGPPVPAAPGTRAGQARDVEPARTLADVAAGLTDEERQRLQAEAVAGDPLAVVVLKSVKSPTLTNDGRPPERYE
jgi:Bifunctional DNA primase/polymerase, N-terminal/Primase C terminal 1 (PriCT-1)